MATLFQHRFATGIRLSSPATASLSRALAVAASHADAADTRSRRFHASARSSIKDFFPEPDAPNIHKTRPAWKHPVYTEEQRNSIVVAHRETRTWSDWTALAAVRSMRWCLDRATGYKHDKHADHEPAAGEGQVRPFAMNENKWMVRNIFLESVAGVPGMVAGMLRHLHSMRRMKRDNGWMETLLEESYNERMHLLTFMKMAEPGLFMRVMVLGAQGVFFNAFFLAYLVSPRTCHRFVGYLEEEAVLTYTREIEDIDAGKLPQWADPRMQAPEIAVTYWQMPEGQRSMRDLLLYIRADEAKHREVNHTLGNLDQRHDPNPFVSEYKDAGRPHPDGTIASLRSTGWERWEVIGEGTAPEGAAAGQVAAGEGAAGGAQPGEAGQGQSASASPSEGHGPGQKQSS